MRKKYNILMNNKQPEGGQWNYDSDNRKPPKAGLDIPSPYHTTIDAITQEAIDITKKHFGEHFGDMLPFYFAVTRQQALKVLSTFIKQRLTHFGTYQDAMIENEPWMYHSHISFYLNCGLLLPLECIQAAETAYQEKQAPSMLLKDSFDKYWDGVSLFAAYINTKCQNTLMRIFSMLSNRCQNFIGQVKPK